MNISLNQYPNNCNQVTSSSACKKTTTDYEDIVNRWLEIKTCDVQEQCTGQMYLHHHKWYAIYSIH